MADTLIQGTTIIEDKRTGKGEVWSCSAPNFTAANPDTDAITIATAALTIDTGTVSVNAPVFLPDGVKVTNAVMYGVFAETWSLIRSDHSGNNDTMASAAGAGTEDTSILFEIIDNKNFSYSFLVSSIDSGGDLVRGARIIYEF